MKDLRERRRRKEERLRALAASAIHARRFAPRETLDMGFELIESARRMHHDRHVREGRRNLSSRTMKGARRSLSSPELKGERIRRCPACGKGELVRANDITSGIEGYTFVERGWRCGSCGEEFIPEEEGERMIAVAKRLGIWGEPLKLRRKLSRSGGGTVLRIPIDIERALGLKGDEEVLITKTGRRIIIEVPGGEPA